MTKTESVRILYMEDDAGLARLVQRNLERAGYVVDIAGDGEQGLAMYDAGSYDVVLIDKNMPVRDGLEVIRIMVSQGSLPPTIMVTGTGNEMTAVDAMKLGARDYIVKDTEGGYLKLLPPVIEQVLHQQQAEKALRESEEKLRSLVENAPSIIVIAARDGMIQFVNRTISGISVEEVIGRKIYDYITPEYHNVVKETIERVFLTGETGSYEAKGVDTNGRYSWLNAQVGSIKRDGQVVAVTLISTDITEKKKAEEHQNAITEGLRAVVATADELITCPDMDTLLRRAVELARDKLGLERCSIFLEDDGHMQGTYGTSRDGRTSDERAHRFPVSENWWVNWKEHFQNLRPQAPRWFISQGTHLEWDGEKATPIGSEGWIAGTLIRSLTGPIGVFYNDAAISEAEVDEAKQEIVAVYCSLLGSIIERKRAEEALKESNRRLEETLTELKATQQQIIQQERLRALGQMASGVAHDFNNALSPILGYSELISMVPAVLDDKEKVTRYLKMINTASRDASNIVTRLREFYRERKEDEIFVSVSPNQLVKQTIELTEAKWKDQAQSNGITISVRTDLQQVPKINGNSSELRNALTNLIFNAVDAIEESGIITIRTHSDGKYVVLEVSDTGAGMTDEVKQRCFEPFFSTKEEQGTGLGLSIVHGIIRRHEGTIDISGESGEGTTFIIRLPIQVEEQAEDEGQEAETTTSPLHVLLVDDKPEVRDVITQYLLVDGHTVETANNGREGVEKFYKGKFDVVITDRAMPDMNGVQLVGFIKQIEPDKPVIMLTGFGDMMKVTGDIPMDVDYLLNKPVTLNNFRRALAKVTAE